MSFASRARHWLPLLPLLGVLGVTYWLSQLMQPLAAVPDSSKRHDPDAIMDNFSATRLNDQGTPRLKMNAARMLHYPDDDSTALELPRITLLTAGSPPLLITSRRGTVSSKGEDVYLHDDVIVIRSPDSQHTELTLRTDYLHVVPDLERADTNRRVKIVDAVNTVTATGLLMDNKARTLKLLSDVSSEHVPAKN